MSKSRKVHGRSVYAEHLFLGHLFSQVPEYFSFTMETQRLRCICERKERVSLV